MMRINDIEVPVLLDSGSVFNMMRQEILQNAKVDLKEGRYMTGSGKTIGTTAIEVSNINQPSQQIKFTVVRDHPLEAILDYPLLKKKTQLCEILAIEDVGICPTCIKNRRT